MTTLYCCFFRPPLSCSCVLLSSIFVDVTSEVVDFRGVQSSWFRLFVRLACPYDGDGGIKERNKILAAICTSKRILAPQYSGMVIFVVWLFNPFLYSGSCNGALHA